VFLAQNSTSAVNSQITGSVSKQVNVVNLSKNEKLRQREIKKENNNLLNKMLKILKVSILREMTINLTFLLQRKNNHE